MMHNRHGVGLVDAMISVFLLTLAGILFGAAFPIGFSAARQARETKLAVGFAQQKLEQVKALGYESLSYENLKVYTIDETPSTSPYSFTSVDNLTSSLGESATGELTIADYAAGVKRAEVVITWQGIKGQNRTVTMETLIADKRPWKEP
ncbi:MAG TPA: hypothetical protein PKV43_10170 [Armatimonadota bacterium]|nr:hypothetical protein [Armatimonadota bacterium]